jgi:hypothetical protein
VDHARVHYETLHNPSLRLLQKDTAPLIISFLFQQFKRNHRVVVPANELMARLEDHLEELNAEEPSVYPRSAAAYLKTWCDEDHRLLRSYYESGSDEPVYELTPAAERVIGWFEDLQPAEFIGAESRFLRIFGLLEEIVGRGGADVATRLAQLEQQKAEIEREIEAIQRTGAVERLTETQIKERFQEASDVARRLLADFREVEHNFRDIAMQVQKAQLEQSVQKGSVVGYVLDADEALQESDQGRSFYAFWDFLRSPSRQDLLRDLLRQASHIPELASARGEHPLLWSIKDNLLAASQKVMQSNHRLAEQLRKMLDERNLAEQRRVRNLIVEIKQAALACLDTPPDDEAFFMLEGTPQVSMPMERGLWEASEPPNFAGQTIDVAEEDATTVDLAALYNQFYVDEMLLRDHVATLLETRTCVTLAEITQHYPVEKGLAEVIMYLAIAAREEHHIDDQQYDVIVLHENGVGTQQLKIPRVIFGQQGLS